MSRNNMQNDLKRILEQLARRQKDTSDIRVLDEELLNPGKEHSELFDSFIEKQELSLSETMASLMTAETDNGRLLIEGYKENYLNEIIQNINDLDIEVQDEEDTSVDISVEKSDGNYILSCSYRDNGFRARDVYGFCNTGKGAKSEEQDGKFGIGIKALLAATSYFEIRSNLIIRYPDDDGSASIAENFDWDQRHTYARYVIPVPDESGDINGIHVGKLENIINLSQPEVVFGDMDYEKLVFDFRSLLFMRRIQKITVNDWILSCVEECRGEDEEAVSELGISSYSIKHVFARRREENEAELSERYLYWCPDKERLGKTDFAFLLDSAKDGKIVPNRLYSVYYIRHLADTIKPLGILINTDHVNSFRNEIASTEEEIKTIKKGLKESVAKTISIWTVNPFNNAEILEAVSIVFFRCLLAYWKDIEEGFQTAGERDHSDLDEIFGLFNYVLANRFTVENLLKINALDNCAQKYVVCKKDIEEYEKFIPGIEDDSIVGKSTKLYFDVFEKNEVISYSQILEDGISSDVTEIYKRVKTTDSEALIHMLTWFGNVSDYVKYVLLDYNRSVDDVSLEEAAAYIREFKKGHTEEETSILQRILGRYRILNFFSETGKIKSDKVNFIDYVFSDKNGDEILCEVFKIYDDKYQGLKKHLKSYQYMLTYCVPYGPSLRRWDGVCASKLIPTGTSNEMIGRVDAGQLFEVIEKQNLYKYIRSIGEDGYSPNYYILNKNTQRSFKIQWKGYVNEHQYRLDAINLSKVIQHISFGIDEFIKYQHVLDRICGSRIDGTDKYLTGSLRVGVFEEKVHVNKLSDLVLWMTKWLNIGGHNNREAVYQAINIGYVDVTDSYNECGTDYIEFVNSITGGAIKDIYLKRLDLDNRGAKTVAYIGAGEEFHARLRKSNDYWKLFRFKIEHDDSRLYVFYANMTKEQALAEVIDSLNLGPDITEQIKGYISVAEIGHSVSSYEYERQLRLNIYDNEVIPDGMELSRQRTALSVREKKKLFMARGSYNGCCPVCGKSLIGEDKDLDKAVNNSFLYTIKLDDGSFFQSCSCSGCLAILRKTYMGAILSGDLLRIRQTIVSGEKETSDNDILIRLSNVNAALKGIDT